MALGIILIVAALIGLIYGITKKRKIMVSVSAIVLIIIAAIGFYFFKNPY